MAGVALKDLLHLTPEEQANLAMGGYRDPSEVAAANGMQGQRGTQYVAPRGGGSEPLVEPNPAARGGGAPANNVEMAAPAAAVQTPGDAMMGLPKAPEIGAHRAELQTQYEKFSKPNDPKDPQFKAKWWQYLIGYLAAAAGGAAGNRNIGSEIGNELEHGKFNRAEDQRKNELDAIMGNIKTEDDQYQRQRQNFGDQMDVVRAGNERTRIGNEKTSLDNSAAREKRLQTEFDEQVTKEYDKKGADGKTHHFGQTRSGKEIELERKPPTSIDAGLMSDDPEDQKRAGTALNRKKSIESKYDKTGGDHKPASPEQLGQLEKQRGLELGKLHDAIAKEQADLALLPPDNPTRKQQEGAIAQRRQQREKEINDTFDRARDVMQNGAETPPAWTGVVTSRVAANVTKGAKTNGARNTKQAAPQGGGGSKQLDKAKAAEYLQKAGGDKDKARQLARGDGYSF
jgi:hypothetical protein